MFCRPHSAIQDSGPMSHNHRISDNFFIEIARCNMNYRDLAGLIILGMLWGASFLFVKVAVPEFGAIALMAARVTMAAAILLPLLFHAPVWMGLVDFYTGEASDLVPYVYGLKSLIFNSFQVLGSFYIFFDNLTTPGGPLVTVFRCVVQILVGTHSKYP